MNVVVTGAAGFIGSTLSEALLADGHQVTGIDCFTDYYPRADKEQNLRASLANGRFRFLELDIAQADLGPVLDGAEWVFHQAAQAGVRASWGAYFSTYTHNNILATQRLLEACRNCTTLQKVVYASSSSVYGNAESFPTTEKMLPQPVSPYGVTKLSAEHLMVLYALEFGVPTVSLRYFTVYGPRQRPDMAFRRFIEGALAGNDLTVYGDGEQSRDFTYVADIVQANIRAAMHGKAGSVLNIGGGTQATVNEVLNILREHFPNLRVHYEERQAGDARRTSADTSLARREIGFSPQTTLKDGLAREVEWVTARHA